MSDKKKDKLRTLQDDLELVAAGEWGKVPSIEEMAKSALVTLAAQKRIMDSLRSALIREAAWVLRERFDEGIDDRCEERLRLCAIRMSESAKVDIDSVIPTQLHPTTVAEVEGD